MILNILINLQFIGVFKKVEIHWLKAEYKKYKNYD